MLNCIFRYLLARHATELQFKATAKASQKTHQAHN